MKASHIALTVGGILGAGALAYLMYRHEQTIAAQAAAQAAAQQQSSTDATLQALEQQVQQMQSYTGYGQSYGSTYADYSQVQGTTLQSVPQDSNLTAILQAFLGQKTTGAVSTASGTTTPTGSSDSNTSSTSTATDTAQLANTASSSGSIGSIPSSLTDVNTVNGITGINQQYASNPTVLSNVGASSGVASTAVQASHTLATTTGLN